MLSLVVSLAVTRCTPRCRLLSFVVTRCTTLCHSLSFVVTRCTTRCHSLPLVVPLVTRCHSLSLVVIRNQLKYTLWNNLIFPISTPQSAIFKIWYLDTNEHLILDHLLLIFKIYVYITRTSSYLNISHLLIYIKGIKDSEKKLCKNDAKGRKKFNKKWKNVLIN